MLHYRQEQEEQGKQGVWGWQPCRSEQQCPERREAGLGRHSYSKQGALHPLRCERVDRRLVRIGDQVVQGLQELSPVGLLWRQGPGHQVPALPRSSARKVRGSEGGEGEDSNREQAEQSLSFLRIVWTGRDPREASKYVHVEFPSIL
jgi:hypothetical protein